MPFAGERTGQSALVEELAGESGPMVLSLRFRTSGYVWQSSSGLEPVPELILVACRGVVDEGTPGRSVGVESPFRQEFRCYRALSRLLMPVNGRRVVVCTRSTPSRVPGASIRDLDDPSAMEALKKFMSDVDGQLRGVCLEPGDLLLVDNYPDGARPGAIPGECRPPRLLAQAGEHHPRPAPLAGRRETATCASSTDSVRTRSSTCSEGSRRPGRR